MIYPPRSTIHVVGFVLLLLPLMTSSPPVRAAEDAPIAVFTASDFPKLAEGVNHGFAGLVRVHVWAPPGDEWHLTTDNGILSLILKTKPGDPEPRWQALGETNLRKGSPLRVIATRDVAKEQRPAPDNAKSKKKEQAKPPSPVPALLLLSSGDGPNKEALLDLIRGAR